MYHEISGGTIIQPDDRQKKLLIETLIMVINNALSPLSLRLIQADDEYDDANSYIVLVSLRISFGSFYVVFREPNETSKFNGIIKFIASAENQLNTGHMIAQKSCAIRVMSPAVNHAVCLFSSATEDRVIFYAKRLV